MKGGSCILFTSPLEGEVVDRGCHSRSTGGGSGAPDRVRDQLKHPVAVLQDLRIPETKDAVSSRFKPVIAASITSALVVLTPIALDYQAMLMGDKINDVGAYGRLPPESHAIETMRTQPIPKTFLGFGHLAAERSRSSAMHLRDDAMTCSL